MTIDTVDCSQERRLIFKVLILGEDPALQAGLLTRASGESVSYQLYSTLGVGLGVASVRLTESCSAVLQLWSLPSIERYRGITKNFVKGHRAIMIVLRPDEVESVTSILDSIDSPYKDSLLIVVVGNEAETGQIIDELTPELEVATYAPSITSVTGVISLMSSILAGLDEYSETLPLIVRIAPELCPPVQPQMTSHKTPPSSEADVKVLKRLSREMGVPVRDNECIIELHEGIAEVDLFLGSVKFRPRLCEHCRKGCKRILNICIVGSDSGWSSDGLEKRSLVTLAKIYGLSHRELPNHVERQLLHATQCSSFTWKIPQMSQEIEQDFGYIPQPRKRSLLEVARNRVDEGRLSESIYNLLERRVSSARSNQDD